MFAATSKVLTFFLSNVSITKKVSIQFNFYFFFISHIIQKVIYNNKNDFQTISMRDVDAIKERIACDWWHPQGYKKNKYVLLSKKQEKKIWWLIKTFKFCFDQKCLEVGLQKN